MAVEVVGALGSVGVPAGGSELESALENLVLGRLRRFLGQWRRADVRPPVPDLEAPPGRGGQGPGRSHLKTTVEPGPNTSAPGPMAAMPCGETPCTRVCSHPTSNLRLPAMAVSNEFPRDSPPLLRFRRNTRVADQMQSPWVRGLVQMPIVGRSKRWNVSYQLPTRISFCPSPLVSPATLTCWPKCSVSVSSIMMSAMSAML